MIRGFYANLMRILAFLFSPEPIKDYQYPLRRLLVYIVTLCVDRIYNRHLYEISLKYKI